MSDQTVWVLFFEDADRKPEFFSGEGAEWASHERFKQASSSWACHLFVNESRLTAAGTRIKETESLCADLSAWITRRLESLEHRDTSEMSSTGFLVSNGFAFSAVPDWELRQKLEAVTTLHAELDKLKGTK